MLGAAAFANGAGWLTAAGASLACWLPAVLLTGPRRYLEVVLRQAETLAREIESKAAKAKKKRKRRGKRRRRR